MVESIIKTNGMKNSNAGQATSSGSSSSSSNSGSLKATILSCYDLPNDLQPSSVVLEMLGSSVETGPPVARHKERNSFKFFGGGESSTSGGSGSGGSSKSPPSNELILSSKLSLLYNSTATFRVKFSSDKEQQQDLIAQFQISRRLNVNETKWLILNLRPESRVQQAAAAAAAAAASTTGGGDDDEDDAATANSLPSTGSSIPPTLRVKLLLSGPYRPEISSLINVGNSYFGIIDKCSKQIEPAIKFVTVDIPQRLPSAKYLLIPAVPISVSVAVCLPILLGIGVIGLPFFLPLLVILLAGISSIAATTTLLYYSTPVGRDKFSTMLQPLWTTFLSTETGQKIVYDTGPRPSPQNLIKLIVPKDMIGKLLVSLALDFVGSTSYLLPVVGEGFDIMWAPIFAICIAGMYDDVMPNLKYVALIEELLPFTDIIPSATMGWMKEFAPHIINHSTRQLHNLTVVARREEAALFRSSNH